MNTWSCVYKSISLAKFINFLLLNVGATNKPQELDDAVLRRLVRISLVSFYTGNVENIVPECHGFHVTLNDQHSSLLENVIFFLELMV